MSSGKQKRQFSLALAIYAVTAFLAIWSHETATANDDRMILQARLLKDSVTVGDRVHLEVTAIYPLGVKLWPVTSETSPDFVVKAVQKGDPKRQDGKEICRFVFEVIPFAVGHLTLPTIEFRSADSAGNVMVDSVPQTTLFVKSVLPADTSGLDIKDISGPISLPGRWWIYASIVAIAVALAAAIYVVRLRHLRKMELPQVPPEPPADKAIRLLQLLWQKELVQKGMFKQYYVELSEILRHYIKGRFDIDAIDLTTTELRRVLKHPELPAEKAKLALLFLGRSDWVKFAKFIPGADVALADYELVRDFILSTRPAEITVEATTGK